MSNHCMNVSNVNGRYRTLRFIYISSWPLNLNLAYKTLGWSRKRNVNGSVSKAQIVSFDHANNSSARAAKMYGFVPD